MAVVAQLVAEARADRRDEARGGRAIGLGLLDAREPDARQLDRQLGVAVQELAPRDQRVGDQLGRVGRREQPVRARPAGERERDVRLPQAGDVDLLLGEQVARVREVVRREAGVLADLRHLGGREARVRQHELEHRVVGREHQHGRLAPDDVLDLLHLLAGDAGVAAARPVDLHEGARVGLGRGLEAAERDRQLVDGLPDGVDLPVLQRLVLAGRVLDEHDLRSSPSAAAAEPGWVVSPPLPTTSARCPGHCDSATVSSRLPGRGAAVGTTAVPATAGGGAPCEASALDRSWSVNATAAIDEPPNIPIKALVAMVICAITDKQAPFASRRCFGLANNARRAPGVSGRAPLETSRQRAAGQACAGVS